MEWRNIFHRSRLYRILLKGIPDKDTFFYFCISIPPTMLNRFKKYISENNLVKPDDRILLAVSGGIDSMVMTHLFLQLGNDIGIAHCNFSLRDEESDKDEELVRSYSAEHMIPFFSIRFETKKIAEKKGISIQMAARELRYEWFEKISKKNNYDSVAVAHNLNDNIETLIINLTRGTGLAGLTGMRPVSNRIIRPLLFSTRMDITDYCNRNQLIFREDKSNAETKYIRNKIRHLVIPILKEINPAIESTLNETIERFNGLNEIVSDYISTLKERVTEKNGELTSMNIRLIKPYMHNKAILFELFKPFGINNLQLNDLVSVINGVTGNQLITDSHRIIKNRKEIIISDNDIPDEIFYSITNIGLLRKFPEIESAEYVDITHNFKIPSDHLRACIDADKISFPLTIRVWKAGDCFFPLGMKNKKKLSDYFIDKKYSKFDKEKILILESDGKIVWIIGDRIDNRFRITESTTKALIIKTQGKGLNTKEIR
jgi:tRNA(Ile)-lysidine synthase